MPNSNTFACAWSEDWEYDFYRFYEPEFSELNEYKPFNFTFDRLYDYELLTDSTSESANLDAWQRYLGPAIPRKDISAMVYGISLDELTAIQANPNGKPALEYSKNALVAEWRANRRQCAYAQRNGSTGVRGRWHDATGLQWHRAGDFCRDSDRGCLPLWRQAQSGLCR